MVIILGTVKVDPARRDEFVAAQAEEAQASRAEPGCVDWTMLLDPDDPGVVRLLEVWADTASFEDHLVVLQERQAAMAERMAELGVTEMVRGVEIMRHDVASSSPLGG